MSARDEFKKAVADTLTQWRHGCIPPRANWSVEAELFRSGIAEILSLRLRVAYSPLLQGLSASKIELISWLQSAKTRMRRQQNFVDIFIF